MKTRCRSLIWTLPALKRERSLRLVGRELRSGGGAAGAEPQAKATASGSLDDELSQLEELERELGIMGVVGSPGEGEGVGAGGGGGGGSEAGKEDQFDMDNLDELEGYLESLAK